MKVTILLKSGRKCEFLNAGIQKTNNGRSTAVYDLSTYRILEDFKSDQIAVCQSSEISKSKADAAQAEGR